MDPTATYEITVVRVPYMGTPVFYARVLADGGDWSARAENYDFQSEPDEKRASSLQRLTLDPDKRGQSSIDCAS